MGMGSGAGSHALAALYPRARGDRRRHRPDHGRAWPRQRFALPEPELPRSATSPRAVFPPGSLDGIFDSSVLHHVTSFGGYGTTHAARGAGGAGRPSSRDYGVLVVRDFLDPGRRAGPARPARRRRRRRRDDPRSCSTRARCSSASPGEFRSSAAGAGLRARAPTRPAPAARAGAASALTHKLAAEFVLRKDYRADWDTEVQEEYTYFTQARVRGAVRAARAARAGLDAALQPVDRAPPLRGQVRAARRSDGRAAGAARRPTT